MIIIMLDDAGRRPKRHDGLYDDEGSQAATRTSTTDVTAM